MRLLPATSAGASAAPQCRPTHAFQHHARSRSGAATGELRDRLSEWLPDLRPLDTHPLQITPDFKALRPRPRQTGPVSQIERISRSIVEETWPEGAGVLHSFSE
jgi:hypothetical protein